MHYNFHNFFRGLTFQEDTHKYFLEGKPLNISVSGIYSKFKQPFKGDAKAYALKNNLSEEEVKIKWKKAGEDSANFGSSVHLFGEKYMWEKSLEPANGFEKSVVNFWKVVPDYILPIQSELMMYHKKYMFSGTADIILYDTVHDEYIIADYKTNKDIHKNFGGQKMLPPFDFLLDTPFNHYKIQLSLYGMMFKQTGLKLGKSRIIWLQDEGNFYCYEVEDYEELLTKWLEENYETNYK